MKKKLTSPIPSARWWHFGFQSTITGPGSLFWNDHMAHGGYQLEDLLRLVITERGNGLRLMPGKVPSIIIKGEPHSVEGPPVTAAETDHFLPSLATSRQMRTFWEEHLLEFDCLVLGAHPSRVYATDDRNTVLLATQRLERKMQRR